MARRRKNEPTTYTCLFCNRSFEKEQVLFADEIAVTRNVAPDATQAAFFSHDFVRAPKTVPTQLWHRWNYSNPTGCMFDGEEMPKIITVRRMDGKLPEGPVSEPSAANDQSRLIAEKMMALDDMATPGIPTKPAQEHESLLSMVLGSIGPEDTKRLDKRICPYCHCIVPKGIGRLPVYRIAMLGGKASGKTTYMLLAASQLVQRNNRHSVLGDELELARGSLVGESALFFDEMFDLCRIGQLPSTQMTENKSVFPLVMCIEPYDNAISPFFLILQDYPGEGMGNGTFMINNPGILDANGVILLVDPDQLRVRRPRAEAKPDAPKEEACQATLDETCENFRENIDQFRKLKEIIVTLHKIDKLYQSGVNDQNGLGPLDRGSLKEDHRERIDTEVLARIDRAACHVFAELLGFPGNANRVAVHFRNLLGCNRIKKRDRRPSLAFKAVSAHTLVPSDTAFVSNVTLGDICYGHRLLEPVLELLYHAGLLPGDADNQKRHGFFGWAAADGGVRR